jgi:arabinose-5-phosphate isomerase
MINTQHSASDVILQEAEALRMLAKNLPINFTKIVQQILHLSGRVILSGMGKSGYIAHKIAASFSSTGTPAFFIHPAEASHGDLGMITKNDLVILLSNSGETKEISDIINYCKRFSVPIVAITANVDSNLAKYSDELMLIPKMPEASNIGAPSTSCVMMLALGDAMMIAAHQARGVSRELYKSLHPGGSIGASLKALSDVMHVGDRVPVAKPETLMPEVLIIMTQKSLGCCAIIDEDRLIGIITDGDLRRHIDKNMLTFRAKDIMSRDPKVLAPDILVYEALQIMNAKNITNVLISSNEKLLGIVHIHDLLKIGAT